jgi:hypothetical protein
VARTRSVSPTPRNADPGRATTAAGGPGSTVAVKVAGETPFTCAVTRAVPAVVPSVHVVLATPRASVVLLVEATEPEPAPTSQSTRRLRTGAPSRSVTTTLSGVGNVAPATPV